ncbi:MAG TPA: ABC transporter substrate-binding protein [Abditibacterium sp.]|jgi:NitT/TauT family transport system substrate-binding protein
MTKAFSLFPRPIWRAFSGATLFTALGLGLAGCGAPAPTAENNSVPAENAVASAPADSSSSAEPITIGYSDWPGWVAWDIADQQGFFKKRGANVKLVWFPVYTDSLNALAAGQVDANSQAWGDTLGPLAQGLPLKAVLVNDNSYGNDAMIAQPGIKSVKELKGKKVATELGTVDHFLMLKALEANGMTEKDIKFVNIKVQDCPAAMLSKQVDAAVVWEPSRTKILKDLKGSTAIFDSADIPGAIPDLLVMKTEVVEKRPEDVQKIVDAWYDAIDWWKKNPDAAIKILAKRTGTSVADYKEFVMGTRIFSAPEAYAAMQKSDKTSSLFVSGKSGAEFLVKAGQVSKVPDYAGAIEPKFVKAAMDKGLGKAAPYVYK